MTTGGWVIAFAALWLVALTIVVLNFADIRRGNTGQRRGTGWFSLLPGIGWLLLVSTLLVNTFAQYRGWSSSRVHSFLDPVILASLVIAAAGVMVTKRRRKGDGRDDLA